MTTRVRGKFQGGNDFVLAFTSAFLLVRWNHRGRYHGVRWIRTAGACGGLRSRRLHRAIVNHDGQCLDMTSTALGTQARVEPCNGSAEQRWAWLLASNGFLIRN